MLADKTSIINYFNLLAVISSFRSSPSTARFAIAIFYWMPWNLSSN
ncbi:MAG TPA: hypothetical protein V6D50_09475 [Chroococcales cyanobacterium]